MASREQIERADWNSFSAEQQAAISEAAAKLEHRFGVKIVVPAALAPGEDVAAPAPSDDDVAGLVAFQEEAARYFENRPTDGEDKAHWANVYNAENCRKTAAFITHQQQQLAAKEAEIERLTQSRDGYAGHSDDRAAECDRLSAKLSAVSRDALSVDGELHNALARADRLERLNRQMVEAIRKAADILHHSLGRQDEKVLDVEPILRAALTETEGKADV